MKLSWFCRPVLNWSSLFVQSVLYSVSWSSEKPWPANKDQRSVPEVEEGNYARRHLPQQIGTNLHRYFQFVKGTIVLLYALSCALYTMPSAGSLCYISYVSPVRSASKGASTVKSFDLSNSFDIRQMKRVLQLTSFAILFGHRTDWINRYTYG